MPMVVKKEGKEGSQVARLGAFEPFKFSFASLSFENSRVKSRVVIDSPTTSFPLSCSIFICIAPKTTTPARDSFQKNMLSKHQNAVVVLLC